MLPPTETDVVIGGGGVAGAAAAAAIQQLGYKVLVIEPGQNSDRRLAGEILHPPGVAGLAELGLLGAVTQAPGVPVHGFSVSLDGEKIQLPYDSVPAHRTPGFCLEHGLIRARMINAVSEFPNITTRCARIVDIDTSEPTHVSVEVADGHDITRYRCRFLVAADGTPSRLARLAGIGVHNRRISTIIGYRVSAGHLPFSAYGHVFLGAETPILLYPIGCGQARILFDISYRSGRRAAPADCLLLAAVLPPALRDEVARAIETQPRNSMLTHAITTARSVLGRVVLVGDAGGSCHPLTATGMTMCISDALMLRKALTEQAGDLVAALRLYEQRRHWPQVTRLSLADILRDTFCGTTPELRMIRGSILSYWRAHPAGRINTLALLSTADGRPFALLREIAVVAIRSFLVHLRRPLPANRDIGAMSVAWALIGNLFRNVRRVLIGPRVGAVPSRIGASSTAENDQVRSPRVIVR